MIAAVIRWAAVFASGIVILSFGFFAADQTSEASNESVRGITGARDAVQEENVEAESATKLVDPPPEIERLRERENGGFHEFVDDVDDVLLSPFTNVTDSDNIWIRRAVPAVIGLLLYGLLGLYLARAAGLRRW